ncbi:hypothetical protein HNR53_004543 [Bacillus benzoevorans]|uniref:Uncharacterized protein n=2 Tax=Bacillus benzoevorans TaxID=1456 RepID=A0A7X0HVW7_9BACI|nr:hypothetical protein [Bacillus benzoevorans]
MKGRNHMYDGRDMTELSMMSKTEWQDNELAFFHYSLQQIMDYLNIEGRSFHNEIITEIEKRGGLRSGVH